MCQKLQEEISAITSQFKKYVPEITDFLSSNNSLLSYSKSLHAYRPKAVFVERQEPIKKALHSSVERLFGTAVANTLNFDSGVVANIADHHQVLNHPFIVSSNFIGNSHRFLSEQKNLPIVTISSGDVPPNNYFSKNGFLFHGKKVFIFSNSEHETCSYYLPKRNFNFTERLKNVGTWHSFSPEEQLFLIDLEEKISNLDFSNCNNYNDQISIIVKNTWPLLFAEEVRNTTPDLLYITQESLVSDILPSILSTDNIVSASLFDEVFRERVLNNFRGNVVTWDEAKQKGTHFFWRKHPNEPRGLRMYLKNNELVPADSRYAYLAVPLTKNAINELLATKEIYPSLFTIFAVLLFYAGAKPLLGYGSLVYLNRMKSAWLQTILTTRFANEKERIESLPLNGFTAGVIIFYERIKEELSVLYAHDIMFKHGLTKEYLTQLQGMKFSNFVSASLIEMYDYYASKYIPKSEQLQFKTTSVELAKHYFEWV